MLVQPGTDDVLARVTLADGTECLVTQSWNGWDNGGEPYTVDFYSRKPGGPWLWQYLDHEARRWGSCRIVPGPAEHSVKVFGDGELRGDLDLNWPYQHEQDPPLRFWNG
ncbi:hypothetical protein [Luteolibacter marinus]|uniref:hypothetical protein n=1 Tax=Luteolibacter marinus TaxID=2776705 RepID=UPI001867EE61|nr:hypothetical protein [Luteolibacter marinus]